MKPKPKYYTWVRKADGTRIRVPDWRGSPASNWAAKGVAAAFWLSLPITAPYLGLAAALTVCGGALAGVIGFAVSEYGSLKKAEGIAEEQDKQRKLCRST